MTNFRLFIYMVTTLMLSTLLPTLAKAQVTPSLAISPSKYDLTVVPGQIQQVEVKVINQSSVAIPLKAEVMDFAPKNTTGGIAFGQALPNHSAAKWLSTSTQDFLLNPGETRPITVSISPSDNLADGSYFAVVMFETSLPSNDFDPQAQAHVLPWLGELFLLKVGQPVVNSSSLTVNQLSMPRFSTKTTIPVTMSITNTSEYHLAPDTVFELKNFKGTVLAASQTGDTTIMPGTTRTFKGQLTRKSPLGFYTADAKIMVAGYSKTIYGGPLYLLTWLGFALIITLIFSHWHVIKHRHRIRHAVKQLVGRQ